MDELIGQRFKSIQCGWYTVVEKVQVRKYIWRYKVEFDEINGFKYSTISEKKHVLSGGIKNPYHPLKLDIACVGNVNSKKHKKEFNKWRAMIERCYDENNNHYNTYGAKGITVCDRWLCFEHFLDDLSKLEGYDYIKLQNGELHLDKDIKGDRKSYSPENCILISATENVKEMNKRINNRKYKATHIETGETIVFSNQSDFAEMVGYQRKSGSNVSACIKGKQKSFAGYKIELLEE